MLHLRRLDLLHTEVMTVSGQSLGKNLDWWEKSERRERFREVLRHLDEVEPDDVILPPERARAQGLTSTMVFPRGNLAPQGSVVKSTAIDPSLIDPDSVYRKTGPARVFTSEPEAIAAIKAGRIKPGDVLVLAGIGPLGTGMEETYQVTGALKHLPFGKQVALLTDGRFSGVSTGPCIGHIGPEALAGGPLGKVIDGDLISIEIDRSLNTGKVDLVGEGSRRFTAEEGIEVLARRAVQADLAPQAKLPADTHLWAALQNVSGGTWAGCVYDPESIVEALRR